MKQQILDDDYDTYESFDPNELEDSDEICPTCNTLLKIAYFANSYDDYTTSVICPNCTWSDTD